jgi:hypothetical protein
MVGLVRSVLAAAALGAIGVAVAGRRFRNWGATKGECASVLSGDEFVPDPADVTTRAVTIKAPGREVWRWLVQIGQDRGGLYSYDWIENLFGLRIHSADQIRPEWQRLRVGDAVRLVPRGWLGLSDGVALPVARVVPGRAFVLREDPSQTPWDAIWSFHVIPHGSARCRLISRSRTARRGRLAWLAGQVIDPITLVMTRRMLLGIKRRAEQNARLAAVS